MKLNRWISLGCFALGLCMLLTGCNTAKPLPEGMDEQAVIAAGQEVFDLLMDEKYEEIVALIREDIRNVEGKEITPEIIVQLVDEHLNAEEVGEFKEVSSTAAEGVTEDGVEPHGVAIFHCKFEEEKVGFGFAFDMDLNLIGLSIARE